MSNFWSFAIPIIAATLLLIAGLTYVRRAAGERAKQGLAEFNERHPEEPHE